jgi:hypothetical protein
MVLVQGGTALSVASGVQGHTMMLHLLLFNSRRRHNETISFPSSIRGVVLRCELLANFDKFSSLIHVSIRWHVGGLPPQSIDTGTVGSCRGAQEGLCMVTGTARSVAHTIGSSGSSAIERLDGLRCLSSHGFRTLSCGVLLMMVVVMVAWQVRVVVTVTRRGDIPWASSCVGVVEVQVLCSVCPWGRST